MASPDLSGFRNAMVRMRAEMGNDVPFFTKAEGTYPPGTAIDPETGKPFDPTITGLGSGWASASIHVGVYTQTPAASREDDAISNAVGWFEEGNIILDADPADYEEVRDATEVEWQNERYEIDDVDGSMLDNIQHRKLVYAKRK